MGNSWSGKKIGAFVCFIFSIISYGLAIFTKNKLEESYRKGLHIFSIILLIIGTVLASLDKQIKNLSKQDVINILIVFLAIILTVMNLLYDHNIIEMTLTTGIAVLSGGTLITA
jgi:uncharacterized membrane protein